MGITNANKGDLDSMGSVIDEKGEVFLSVEDLVRHLERNRHRMNDVQPEYLTAERFITLLRTFEKGIKESDNEQTN